MFIQILETWSILNVEARIEFSCILWIFDQNNILGDTNSTEINNYKQRTRERHKEWVVSLCGLTRRRSLISVVKQFTRKMSKTSRRTLSSFSSNKDFAANDFSFAAIFFSVLQSSLNYIMIKGNILRKVINWQKKIHKLVDRILRLSASSLLNLGKHMKPK